VSISHLVEDLITSAGYPAVFALAGAESLGIPLPGQVPVRPPRREAGLLRPVRLRGVLERLSLTVDLVLGGIAALAVIGGIVLLRRRMAGLTERAGKAYPGPLE
jgi:hypothetical protein